MIINFTLIMIGFSIISALLLLIGYWSIYQSLSKTWLAGAASAGLLLGLVALQWRHMAYLLGDPGSVQNLGYCLLLFTVAPCFFLFSRQTLDIAARNNPLLLLHFAPLLLCPLLDREFAIPVAFALGTGYAIWFSRKVYQLRSQREHFRLEFSAFAGFSAIALAILLLGLSANFVGEAVFIITYANLIALSFIAIIYVLLRFPDITQKAAEAIIASYAASTLKKVDCEPVLTRLQELMEKEKIYRNEELSLAELASALELNAHQTSELINTHFAMGFSRFIRSYRINEAKQMLIHEPRASVLSVGLTVGFTSQSNFYTAFREFTGETPGQFRKRQGISEIPDNRD
jgi:AraC-like DNA-binding protein